MSGFQIQTYGGVITLQARQRGDGSWVQEIDVAPARKTGISPAEKLTVGVGAVVSLSPPGGATHAMLAVEGADIRYYDTGDTPTTGLTGNGPILPAGEFLELDLAAMAAFKMIGVSTTATVHVLYWRYGS